MSFDPKKVERYDLYEYSTSIHDPFPVISAADYDQLLALYRELGDALHTYQVTVERAIAEGHDVVWLKAEVKRLLA